MPNLAISSLTAGADAVGAELAADRSGETVKLTPEQIVTSRLASATPAEVGSATVGVGTTAARADHVHAHGDQAGGSLHANAIAGGAAGFMSGADKTALDNAEPRPSITTSASTAFSTIAWSDREMIRTTAGTTVTVSVTTLPAGTMISFVQEGAGQIQLSAVSASLRYDTATFLPRTASQWSMITLIWLTTTSVLVVGDLELV